MSDIGIDSSSPGEEMDNRSLRLSRAEMQMLLCDIDFALTDYGTLAQACKYDTSAFDKETASHYRDVLSGLGDNPSLVDVADLTAQMPEMITAIKKYSYSQSTMDTDPSLLDSKCKGKGKEHASTRAAADGPGTSDHLSDSFDARRSYACLVRMLELRQARQDAFEELLKGAPTDLEGFVESDQPDEQLPPAIILRSIERGQTSLMLDGKDMGCLFTFSHAAQINAIKEFCASWEEYMAGESTSPDVKSMAAWRSDLFELFERALRTPDDEFEVDEGIDTENVPGDLLTEAQTQKDSDWVPDGASPAEIEKMFATMEAQQDKEEHTSRR